ncbi:MAG TPA: hypothetical protein VJT73_14455 [Polyangiaceae bacterium]|nr:hypothetical protein [Polyangiaceae bacterium]
MIERRRQGKWALFLFFFALVCARCVPEEIIVATVEFDAGTEKEASSLPEPQPEASLGVDVATGPDAEPDAGAAIDASRARDASQATDAAQATDAMETDAGGGPSCKNNGECPPNAFCAKPSCGLPFGRCQLRPAICDSNAQPTCGCDGVTYWNDCLRRRSGVAASVPDECTTGAAPCSDPNGSDCPVAGAACARLLPLGGTCSQNVVGACWMLPTVCPDRPPPEFWISCRDGRLCEDTCRAIRSCEAHQLDTKRMCH